MMTGEKQRTIKNGIRCSAATAYLNPAKQRENLTIVTSALVEHVVLENKTAIGACYRHNGKQKIITCVLVKSRKSEMTDHGYSCHVSILRPKSMGTITLRTALASDAPVIDFNFFSHSDDKKTITDGIKLARKILAAPAFDNRRGEEIHPGKDAQSDEAIFKKCKERLGTVFHPVGTCRMGQDSMAVVDHHLKVHGIENLRVIDASIMPSLISGNTNAPTIAIAEYAADIVLGDT